MTQHDLVVGFNTTTWCAGDGGGVMSAEANGVTLDLLAVRLLVAEMFSPRIAEGRIGVAKMHSVCLKWLSSILF